MANTGNEGDQSVPPALHRYISADVAEMLLEGIEVLEAEESGSERLREVTILYIHVHNCDDVLAQLTPEASVEVLNNYFEGAVSALFECKGTFDKYVGADILAVFGSPISLEDHAWMAAQAALAINQHVQELQIMSTLAEQRSLQISIGMHSGQLCIDGTNQRNTAGMDVISKDVINQAVRLSKLGPQYTCSILMTESTRCLLNDRLPMREVGTANLALEQWFGQNQAAIEP